MSRPTYRGWRGAHLRALREARGWNQRQLAIRLGVYPTMVGKWERGEVVPSPHRVTVLAGTFGVRPQEFTEAPVEGATLTDLRLWAGLTRAEAAEAAGLAIDRLLRVEHLTTRPSGAEAARLGELYGVSAQAVTAAWDRQLADELATTAS